MSTASTSWVAGRWRKLTRVLFKSLHMFQELLGHSAATEDLLCPPPTCPVAQSHNLLAIEWHFLSPGLLLTLLLIPEIFSIYLGFSDSRRPNVGHSSAKSCYPESSFPFFSSKCLHEAFSELSHSAPQSTHLGFISQFAYRSPLPKFISLNYFWKAQLFLCPQCQLPKWLRKHC